CPPEVNNESAPTASIVRFEFPALGDRPAVTLTWWDGGLMPWRPEELEPERQMGGGDGMLYIGDKGKILNHRLIPETRMKEYGAPPKILPRSPGHYQEWINACKGGDPAGSNFDFAGPLTEAVLLGNIAIRTGKKICWDSETMTITNVPEANALINPPYREGWSLGV
ncbi:MAG TPA: gfo/Idh/MocA family oxidoreductase, partial [Candidatus Hydrogenedentes bacterium]|nr:gfo/Idh/MocA family oxidoreductase [Candidatus Hydrogenedentota bacterium]